MDYKFLIFLLCLVLASVRMLGQESLYGQVKNVAGEGLPFATLTIHSPGSDSIRAFTSTDYRGDFEFAEFTASGAVEIRTRSLGSKTDTSLISLPYANPLLITLRQGKNDLPKAVVSGKRPPITEQGDTTTFNVSDFRDSTDRKIEEVLRKLPGVDVKENGAIEVNGKPLGRILVEGSDLFGADYQLGSKNLNARDIGRIQIIDHFEDNLVLKSVNTSEEIVLNLELEDKVNAAIAGNVIAGAGYGGENKYSLYTSLYRIARKHKSIFIGDTDNIASGLGFRGIGANYNTGTGDYLRRPALGQLDLNNRPAIRSAGLPREYTDNARAGFGTLRHESELGKRWRMNLNGSRERRRAFQTIRNRQEFIGGQTNYLLENQHRWDGTSSTAEGEFTLNYLSKRQATSLDLYFVGSNSSTDAAQNFTSNTDTTQFRSTNGFSQVTGRVALSHAFRPGLVAQFRAFFGQSHQSANVIFSDERLNGILREFNVRSEYTLPRATAGLQAKVLLKRKLTLYQIGISQGQERSDDPGLDRVYTSLEGGMLRTVSSKTELRANARVRYNTFAEPEAKNALDYRGNVAISHETTSTGKINVSANAGRAIPSTVRRLRDLAYVYDPFQVVGNSPPPELGSFLNVRAGIASRSNYKLTSFNVQANYSLRVNLPNFAGMFRDPYVIALYQYGLSRETASVTGRHSWFVSALKSDVAIRLGTGLTRSNVGINGEDATLRFWSRSVRLEGGVLLFKHLRCKLNTSLTGRRRLGAVSTEFITAGTNLLLLYRTKFGSVFSGLAQNVAISAGQQQVAYGLHVGAKRTFKFGEREVLVSGKLYNPFNAETFENQTTGDLFIYTEVVPALPRYFLLKVDFSL